MQFKHKLIYFALGCAFVVIGQVLLSVVVPKVTAQNKKMSAEFDTVTCRSLKVLDSEGRVRAQLEVTKRPSAALIEDVMYIFNQAGLSVYRLGVDNARGGNMFIYGKNMKTYVMLDASSDGGGVGISGKDGSVSMSVESDSSRLDLYSRGKKRVMLGASSVFGGMMGILNNNGGISATMGVNEHGHGVVGTYDKDGVVTDVLGGVSSSKSTSSSSTPQGEGKFEDVKLFPSKDFVEIGEGYAVRYLQFKPYAELAIKVIGEVRIPAYEGTKALTATFAISLFDLFGKYLGGERFFVYGVRPTGGIYPFEVSVIDIPSEKVDYCQIRPQGAWKPKEE